MNIFAMFLKSLLGYTIYLGTRKLVSGAFGIGDKINNAFRLHRCPKCWSLFSGGELICGWCGHETNALYYDYEPLDPRMINKDYYDRNKYYSNTESSRNNWRRDSERPRKKYGDRRFSTSNSQGEENIRKDY